MRLRSNYRIIGLIACTVILASCSSKKEKATDESKTLNSEKIYTQDVNPYLSKGDYVSPYLGSNQNSLFKEKIKPYNYQIYTDRLRGILTGIMPVMCVEGKDDSHYWLADYNNIYYISTQGHKLTLLSKMQLSEMPLDTATIRNFANTYYTTGTDMDNKVKEVFGKIGETRVQNGKYSLSDNDNIFYSIYDRKLLAFKLNDETDPTKGISKIAEYSFNECISEEDYVVGIQMTFDGYIIANTEMGHFCVLTRKTLELKNQLQIVPVQKFFAPAAIDKNNGIYVLSDSLMIKMVWNGTNLSLMESEGSWNYPIAYDNDSALLNNGGGILGAPALMGYGNDSDKLVIITDGAKKANLIAFWRDKIPDDAVLLNGESSKRIAGKIPIKCGAKGENIPQYIQSFHSIPVLGYGAFVANTINGYPTPTMFLDYALLGSLFPTAKGGEKFTWDTKENKWISIWSNSEIGCTAMQPQVSLDKKMVFVNSFDSRNSVEGWSVKGFDWETGTLINKIIFGSQTQYGNGGAGYFQFINDDNFIFNSITGTYMVSFAFEGENEAPRL